MEDPQPHLRRHCCCYGRTMGLMFLPIPVPLANARMRSHALSGKVVKNACHWSIEMRQFWCKVKLSRSSEISVAILALCASSLAMFHFARVGMATETLGDT